MVILGCLIVGLLLLLSGCLSLRDWFRSKHCQKHGSFGSCGRCKEDAASKSLAEAEERAEAERKRLDVAETFRDMDEAQRYELTTIVMERVDRLNLLMRPEGLEQSVVTLYRKRQCRCD
jgi:hypothetical protein